MLNRRVQLLLEKDMWNRIVKAAKTQKVSAGEYVRRAVDSYMEGLEQEDKNKQATFKTFFKSRKS